METKGAGQQAAARPSAAAARALRDQRQKTAQREALKRRRRRRKIIVLAAVLVVVAAMAALVGGFAWFRWFSADDAADLQGTWYLAGTGTPIVITDDRIQLTDDVAYRYELDEGDKTFELAFGNLTGSGRYRFSLDRNEVALVDGAFTGTDTLVDDIGWLVDAFVHSLRNEELPPAVSGKGVTLLTRESSNMLPAEAHDTPAEG